MVASYNAHVEVVGKLLQHGARVDLQNKVRYPHLLVFGICADLFVVH